MGEFRSHVTVSLFHEINSKMEDGKELHREQILFHQDFAAFYFRLRWYKKVLINWFFFPPPIRFYFKTSICSILIICFQNPGMIPNVSYGNIMLFIKKEKFKAQVPNLWNTWLGKKSIFNCICRFCPFSSGNRNHSNNIAVNAIRKCPLVTVWFCELPRLFSIANHHWTCSSHSGFC